MHPLTERDPNSYTITVRSRQLKPLKTYLSYVCLVKDNQFKLDFYRNGKTSFSKKKTN